MKRRGSSDGASALARRRVARPRKVVAVLTHHKSGTAMARLAAKFVRNSSNSFGLIQKDCNAPTGDKCLWSEQQMSLHIARNPFQVVASGYAYHKRPARLVKCVRGDCDACDDAWLDAPWRSAQAFNAFYDTRVREQGLSKVCGDSGPGHSWLVPLRDSVRLVENYTGTWMLPGYTAVNESYRSYLQRLPLDDGLLAEALFALGSSLGGMRWLSARHALEASWEPSGETAGTPKIIRFCLEAFEGLPQCHSSWARAMRAAGAPSDAIGLAAAKACQRGTHPHGHSASTATEKGHYVTRLRRLDHSALQGQLHELESVVQCP